MTQAEAGTTLYVLHTAMCRKNTLFRLQVSVMHLNCKTIFLKRDCQIVQGDQSLSSHVIRTIAVDN